MILIPIRYLILKQNNKNTEKALQVRSFGIQRNHNIKIMLCILLFIVRVTNSEFL